MLIHISFQHFCTNLFICRHCNLSVHITCIYLSMFIYIYLCYLVHDLVVLDGELDDLVVSHAPAHPLEDVQVRGHREVPVQHDVEHWTLSIYLSIYVSIFLVWFMILLQHHCTAYNATRYGSGPRIWSQNMDIAPSIILDTWCKIMSFLSRWFIYVLFFSILVML